MNIMPLIQFWGKHGEQITGLVEKNKTGPHIFLDLAWSLAPFIERHFPKANENGILDDALAALQASFDDSPPAA